MKSMALFGSLAAVVVLLTNISAAKATADVTLDGATPHSTAIATKEPQPDFGDWKQYVVTYTVTVAGRSDITFPGECASPSQVLMLGGCLYTDGGDHSPALNGSYAFRNETTGISSWGCSYSNVMPGQQIAVQVFCK
jgi:hypothetical protein